MSFFATLPDSVRRSLDLFEQEYTGALSSTSAEMTRAVDAIYHASGKRVRPLILILTAGCFGEVDRKVIDGAVFIELLHAATLIHDDVIDESDTRRGAPALHSVVGSHKAVLMGDFVLATAMTKAARTHNYNVVESLAMLGRMLIEGEFRQMDAARRGCPSEEEYFDIINYKTASLMSMSVYIGACLVGVTDTTILSELSDAALKLGLAFQIKDDIFDYRLDATIGKPTGNDLRDHKVTLPLIYALQRSVDRTKVERILNHLDHETLSEAQIEEIIDFVHSAKGVTYAEEKMHTLIEESKALFITHLPECEERASLLSLCDYVGHRVK